MMRGGVEIRRRRRCLADDGRRGSGGRHSTVGLCVDVTLFPIPHSNSINRICLSSVALNLSNKPDGRVITSNGSDYSILILCNFLGFFM
ncbi:hypothetical protein LINPERHAP1_LOCUS11729 [Linum perenne]